LLAADSHQRLDEPLGLDLERRLLNV